MVHVPVVSNIQKQLFAKLLLYPAMEDVHDGVKIQILRILKKQLDVEML